MNTSFVRSAAAWFCGALLATPALAYQSGWMSVNLPDARSGATPTTVALYYPTQAAERAVPMGPFTPHVAIGAEPIAAMKGLIVLSHGTGGSELGHTSVAQALARAGYLVAALRHPGDNWADRSLLKETPERYFDERPRQATRVIDALLRDARWKDRIASDTQGPRIGAVGHSAGGYTVLALAGGQPDLARMGRHCRDEAAEDPVFCSMGRTDAGAAASPSATGELRDPRVRAVVALVPVGAVFTPQSLAAIRVPTTVYAADQDSFLVPRFHAQWIARNMPAATLRPVSGGGHFAFMDSPAMPLPTEGGDVGADPVGFDRAAFLARLCEELPAFFDQAWR